MNNKKKIIINKCVVNICKQTRITHHVVNACKQTRITHTAQISKQ